MRALSIVALVVAGLSFFIPIGGVFLAILASLMAVISFRSEATLSGVAVGLNLINTAFFSPSIVIAEGANQVADGEGSVYFFYVGIHVVALIVGIILAMTKKEEDSAQ